MEVGDDDFRVVDRIEHVVRHDLARAVVALGIIGLQDPQAVLDGEAGCADEEAAREMRAAGAAYMVDGLPGDQHRHDGGLAGAGGELQRQAQQLRVGLLVDRGEILEKTLPVAPVGHNRLHAQVRA